MIDLIDRFLNVFDQRKADFDLVLRAQQYQVEGRQVERVGHGDGQLIIDQMDRDDITGRGDADWDRIGAVRIGSVAR